MSLRIPENIDSKFRFILIAAERAKQIQNGAPAKLELKSRKPAFIAIKETEANLVEFDLLEEENGEE